MPEENGAQRLRLPGALVEATNLWLPLVVGVLAVSTGSILVKLCSVSSLSMAAYRLSFAVPIFWLITWRKEKHWWRKISYRDRVGILLSGVCLGLHFATWIASLGFTSVTSSVVLVTTNPLFVGLGSVIFLKERVSPRLWLGILIAFLGCLVIAATEPGHPRTAPNPLWGNLLALTGAMFMSGYLLLGRGLQTRLSTWIYVTSVYTVAAFTLLGLVVISGSPMVGFSGTNWLLLGLMALIPQGIGHTLLNRSLRLLPASVVALAILGEPVGASWMAAAWLDEVPSLMQMAGALLVLTGVGLGVASKTAEVAMESTRTLENTVP